MTDDAQIDSIANLSDREVREALESGRLRGYATGRGQLASTAGMSSEEIAKATSEGRLDAYLATPK